MSNVILLESVLSPAPNNQIGHLPTDSQTLAVPDAVNVYLKTMVERPYQRFAIVLDHDFNDTNVKEVHKCAPLCFHATDTETLMAFWKIIEEHNAHDRMIVHLGFNLGHQGDTCASFLTSLKDAWLASEIDYIPSDIRCHSMNLTAQRTLLKELEVLRGIVGKGVKS